MRGSHMLCARLPAHRERAPRPSERRRSCERQSGKPRQQRWPDRCSAFGPPLRMSSPATLSSRRDMRCRSLPCRPSSQPTSPNACTPAAPPPRAATKPATVLPTSALSRKRAQPLSRPAFIPSALPRNPAHHLSASRRRVSSSPTHQARAATLTASTSPTPPRADGFKPALFLVSFFIFLEQLRKSNARTAKKGVERAEASLKA